ncbi:MAG: TetR/AcrR family transcriptional regulator [Rhodospirillales bacterium]|nr:TetR/AcrR family transcriptional regulator [Rhodospirillales bacterium]
MGRGRPRKIKPEQALEAAVTLFWEKGFEATTLNDLVNATGMAKPGLYAAFGDKGSLYTKALTHYHTAKAEPVLAALESDTAPLKPRIKAYLETIAAGMADEATPQACFLVNSVMECRGELSPLREASMALNARRVAALKTGFDGARARNEIPADADAAALAEFYSAQTAALAVMGRTNNDRQAMQKMIEMAMAAWPS